VFRADRVDSQFSAADRVVVEVWPLDLAVLDVRRRDHLCGYSATDAAKGDQHCGTHNDCAHATAHNASF